MTHREKNPRFSGL